MKITKLTIQPVTYYLPLSAANPLRAVVQLSDQVTSVETIIPDEMMDALLQLVAGIVTKAATQNVADFAHAVNQLEAEKALTA